MPPLHIAALYGKTKVAELLLNRGANVQQRDDGNRTALHGAAFLGRVGVVRLLLDRGIDVSVRGDDDDTAMDSTNADWEMTQGIASWLRVPELDQKRVESGRERVRNLFVRLEHLLSRTHQIQKIVLILLRTKTLALFNNLVSSRLLRPFVPDTPAGSNRTGFKQLSKKSDKKESRDQGIFGNLKPRHLIFSRVFDHLWFLWFLCWLIPLFVCAESLLRWFGDFGSKAMAFSDQCIHLVDGSSHTSSTTTHGYDDTQNALWTGYKSWDSSTASSSCVLRHLLWVRHVGIHLGCKS